MKRGFTLIEILVVMALVAITVGFALVVSMETYRGTSFRTERNMVVALLERARSQSISNYCLGCTDGKAHGVYFDSVNHKYVLYQGANYAARDVAADAIFDANSTITLTGFTDVSFAQLTALSTTVGGSTLTMTDSVGHSSVITIGSEGQVNWTN